MKYEILINNIKFEILGKIDSDRKYVLVISETENKLQTLLYFYQSLSELGIWRLNCNEEVRYDETSNEILLTNSSTIPKGDNYITSSCVAFELQLFINANYELLQDLKCKGEAFFKYITKINSNTCNAVMRSIGSSENVLNEVNDEYLLFLSKCEPSKCFTKNVYGTDLYKFTEELIFNIDKLKDYELYFLYLLDQNSQNNDQTKHFIKCSSIFIEKYYIGSNSYTELGNQYKFTVDNNDIIVQLCKTILKRRDGKFSYDVIFLYYGVKNKNNDDYVWFNIIINLIATTATINNYGLYSQITSSGVYSVKPFDYLQQSFYMATPGITHKLTYRFIGNNYNDMYPLNLLTLLPKSSNGKNYDSKYIFINELSYINKKWYTNEHIIGENNFEKSIKKDGGLFKKPNVDKDGKVINVFSMKFANNILINDPEKYSQASDSYDKSYDKYISKNKNMIEKYDDGKIIDDFINFIKHDVTLLCENFNPIMFKKIAITSHVIKELSINKHIFFYNFMLIYVYIDCVEFDEKVNIRIKKLYDSIKTYIKTSIKTYKLEQTYINIIKSYIINMLNYATQLIELDEKNIKIKTEILNLIDTTLLNFVEYPQNGGKTKYVNFKNKYLKYENKINNILISSKKKIDIS
jgi:hypothetical protein